MERQLLYDMPFYLAALHGQPLPFYSLLSELLEKYHHSPGELVTIHALSAQVDILDNELVSDIKAMQNCSLQYYTAYLQNKIKQYLYFHGYTE